MVITIITADKLHYDDDQDDDDDDYQDDDGKDDDDDQDLLQCDFLGSPPPLPHARPQSLHHP